MPDTVLGGLSVKSPTPKENGKGIDNRINVWYDKRIIRRERYYADHK